jgi:CcmD family protein
MKDASYLYAAYAATWIIHITYLWIVARRYKRLQRKIQQLNKNL